MLNLVEDGGTGLVSIRVCQFHHDRKSTPSLQLARTLLQASLVKRSGVPDLLSIFRAPERSTGWPLPEFGQKSPRPPLYPSQW